MKKIFSLFTFCFSLFAAAVLLAACEKQIDIDVDDLEPQVVVKAQTEVGTPLSVGLTYSRPVYGNFYVYYGDDYFRKVTDATVTLTVDGTATETTTHNSGTYTFAHIPQPGEVLKLNISVPGHDEVSATDTVPLRPNISDIDTSSTIGDGYFDVMQNINIDFSLNDDASVDNYYSIRLREVDTIITTYSDNNGNIVSQDASMDEFYCWFECTDYLLVSNTNIDVDIEDPTVSSTYSGTAMYFTDATINGQSHRIRIKPRQYSWGYGYYDYEDYYPSDITANVTLYLEVTAFSRDLYLYRQTINSYIDDELLGFFSEPVQVHSNISGGIGIFGVSSTTVNQITLRPFSIYK